MSVYLVIYRPDGEIYRTEGQEDDRYDLSERMNSTNRPITIGRDVGTDIQLPDQHISRRHFAIEYIDPYYYVKDLNSTNGITLRYSDGRRIFIKEQPELCERLRDRNEILVLSKEEGSPDQYWKFVFHDPHTTQRIESVDPSNDRPVQAIIYQYRLGDGLYVSLDSGKPIRIGFTGQEFILLNYLAQYYYDSSQRGDGNYTVNYEELIKKIWEGNSFPRKANDLSNIVCRIHKKIRDNCSNVPDLISNRSGVGYRLDNCKVTKLDRPQS